MQQLQVQVTDQPLTSLRVKDSATAVNKQCNIITKCNICRCK